MKENGVSNGTVPDYDYWIKAPYWTHIPGVLVSEALCLINGIRPNNEFSSQEFVDYISANHGPVFELPFSVVSKQFHMLERSIFTDELSHEKIVVEEGFRDEIKNINFLIYWELFTFTSTFYKNKKTKIIEFHIKPVDFIRWAKKIKVFKIPEPLLEFLNDNQTENPLTTEGQKISTSGITAIKDYQDFIRKTKIVLKDDDNTCVIINSPDRKQSITRSKYDLGFSDKATAIWKTFSLILKDGYIYLGIISKDKGKRMFFDDIKKYQKGHKELQRISVKLTEYFNKEWPGINIPDGYNFIEPWNSNLDKGVFKPKFITEKEIQGVEIIRRFHNKGLSTVKFLDADDAEDEKHRQ